MSWIILIYSVICFVVLIFSGYIDEHIIKNDARWPGYIGLDKGIVLLWFLSVPFILIAGGLITLIEKIKKIDSGEQKKSVKQSFRIFLFSFITVAVVLYFINMMSSTVSWFIYPPLSPLVVVFIDSFVLALLITGVHYLIKRYKKTSGQGPLS
ncbi:MAG: hypothetical protein Q8Q06_01785 [bacterium]|nr:hypothetical protein [bacterium]